MSPVDVVDAHLDRIRRIDGQIGAYVTVLEADVREAAKRAETELGTGVPLGVLHGVPIAVKDEWDIAGVPTTHGCAPLARHVADSDSSVVARLREAGALILGKTNLPEFGHKGVTDNRLIGPSSTPFAPGRNAGGSSGGSAAAVGACMASVAQGSDGGGSIRIPASFCGVYGLKPSWARVPWVERPNAFASYFPFQSPAGPLARTVEDAALMLDAMAGFDCRDPFSFPLLQSSFTNALRGPVAGLRVAYSPDFGGVPVEPNLAGVVEEALSAFEELGMHVEGVELRLPQEHGDLTRAWKRMAALGIAEMVLALRRDGVDLEEHREEIPDSLFDYLDIARPLTAVDVRLDDQLRTRVFDALEDLFASFDLLVTPTVAVPPPCNRDDGRTTGPDCVAGVKIDPLLGWALTFLVNFTGHPAACVPAGTDRLGLPVGMQIVGRRFADDAVLCASAAFERARPWHAAYKRILKPAAATSTAATGEQTTNRANGG